MRRLAGAGLGALGLTAAALVAPPVAVAQPVGPPLVSETFTGATADGNFTGYGAACLTGAPAGATPPAGGHPLEGCPADSVGPVPPTDGAPYGYLRLTDASNDQTGAVLYGQAIPATQGLVATFEQWQYGNTTAGPADGISFFLIDGSASLTAPGAFGGSLGYAQKTPDGQPDGPIQPGVNRGYLGVGLDVFGNFFGDAEQRGNGCAQRSPSGTETQRPAPNVITLRGPGNGTQGYCFITATTSNFTTTGPWPSTLPGQLQGPTTSLPADVTPQQAETLLEPSRRTVTVEVSPAPDPVVTVTVDFNDGAGPQQVLSAPAPEPVPDTYKFGFAASTGGFTDVHLIRNVTVSSAAALPQLNLIKQIPADAGLPDPVPVGTRVPYEYVVTNSGNTDIADLVVTDDHVADVVCPDTTLSPGESVTCTGSYVVTAADGDAGSVTNTATATGTSDGDTVTSPPDDATVDVAPAPSPAIHLDKEETFPGTTYEVGQRIDYTYTVTNTGNTEITGITVDDDVVEDVTCAETTLAPGESTTCTGSHVATPEDGDRGQVVNIATASGTSDGGTVTSPPDSVAVPVIPRQTPSLGIEKSVLDPRVYQVGDQVFYEYVVTNTGNTEITDVYVQDDRVGRVTCPQTVLSPGESTTCQAVYVVDAGDAEAGSVTNTATANGDFNGTPVVSPPDSVTVAVAAPAPGLVIEKAADAPGPYDVGDTIDYTYTVTNSGNTVITDLTVQDDRVTGVTCAETELFPGQSTTCTGSYVVTEADSDTGSVTNTATANGDFNGTPVVSPPDTVTVPVNPVAEPSLHLDKAPDAPGPYDVGDTIDYTYTVTNTGNTTITGVTVEDDLVPDVTCAATTLAPGESTTCTGSHVVTEADSDTGLVTNTATANGDSGGTPVVSPPDTVTVPVNPPALPGLMIDKSAGDPGPYEVGDTIEYTYVVTNTGNTTITGVTVEDDLVPDVTCAATTLAPGESTTCTGSHVVTAADGDAGSVANTATANGDSDGTPVESPPDTVTVPVNEPARPGLLIEKAALDPGPHRVGDTIEYEYLVVNSGNTTITGLTVDDDRVTDVTCAVTTLAPGEFTTCTGSYVVTQEDVDAGFVTNHAVAEGDSDGTPVVSPPDSVTVPTEPSDEGGLHLKKKAKHEGPYKFGETVHYLYVVTNETDRTLDGLTVEDDLIADVACPDTTLEPGESVTCKGSYKVEKAPGVCGHLTNHAVATADGVRSNEASATVKLKKPCDKEHKPHEAAL
ncbi:hypothetical protein [Streptomyces sp. NPDC049881]|uniref:DUF7507 domain-containing protein n=1 Tax=Streptomyces sp. NPDC049881 TaxID=3155778 RepID=UPI0034296BC7